MKPRDLRRVRLASQHLRLIATLEAPPRRSRLPEACMVVGCVVASLMLLALLLATHQRPRVGVVQSVTPGPVPAAIIRTIDGLERLPAPMGAHRGEVVRATSGGVTP